jgi:uncharacterized membrane-anchored protein YhcB (DUF1043 family)
MFRIDDTERLDRTAVQCAAIGALCVAAGSVMPGRGGDCLLWAGPTAMLAATATSSRERVRGLLLGGAAVCSSAVFAGYALFAHAVAGGLLGLGLARNVLSAQKSEFQEGEGVNQQWASVLLASLAWPLAIMALRSVQGFSVTQSAVPPVLVQSAAGGVAGLLLGLTTAPLFVRSLGDPVAEALNKMQPTLDSELRSVVLRIVETRARAIKLLQQSRVSTAARNETWRSLNAVALTAVELTNRFASVDRVLSRILLPDIEARALTLRTQLVETTDAGVKRDLERTLTTLDEQRQQVKRLIQGRARLVARLQSELASLEKTEMSFALLASGDAALAGLQLESIGSNLIQQAHEFEAEGAALQEMLTVSPSQALQKLAR